jgi:hypothetical protein
MSTTQFDSRPGEPGRYLVGPETGSAVPGLPVLPSLGEEAGFTLARLVVVVVGTIMADRVLGLAQDAAWAVLAAVTVWALTPGVRVVTAVAGAGLVWLLGTGFLTNRLGELSFGPIDRGHLAVLALAAVIALLVSRRARTVTAADDETNGSGQ